MNDPAAALFSAFEQDIISETKHLASRIRKIVSAETLTAEQHRLLETTLRYELESLTMSFLARLDNAGGSLPEGILGYRILAVMSDPSKPDEYEPLPEVDIRQDEEDYADTWHEFLAN